MTAVAESLEKGGLAKGQIRQELFSGEQLGRAKRAAVLEKQGETGVAGNVTIGGVARALTISPGNSLLEAAIENNLDAPFACRAGVCSTCKARLIEGDVEMGSNHALEDYEVEAGFVLTCQCYPVSAEKVVWDYDQSGH